MEGKCTPGPADHGFGEFMQRDLAAQAKARAALAKAFPA
jgi:hypothetical protein